MNTKFIIIKKKNIIYCLLTVIIVISLGLLLYNFSGIESDALKTFFLPTSNKIILIDPGHGGIDAGGSANGAIEKDINLDIALKLQKYIEESGGIAHLTRAEDKSTADKNRSKNLTQKKSDLIERKKDIQRTDAQIFISIHMNKFQDEKYYGAQVFYPENNEESKKLGECIQTSLKNNLDKTNKRKIKPGNSIYVLKENEIPSVLIECGFLSNKNEAEKFKNEKHRQKTAWAIYLGILDYFNKSLQ